MNITMTDAKALVLVKMKHRAYRNLIAFMKMRKMLTSHVFLINCIVQNLMHR